MAYEKLVEMIKRLLYTTQQGKISWSRSSDKAAFQAAFPQYAVSIRRMRTEKAGSYVIITLLDAEGEEIETVNSSILSQEDLGMHDTCQELYEHARRNAMGADKAVATILSNLDKLPKDPKDDDDIPF